MHLQIQPYSTIPKASNHIVRSRKNVSKYYVLCSDWFKETSKKSRFDFLPLIQVQSAAHYIKIYFIVVYSSSLWTLEWHLDVDISGESCCLSRRCQLIVKLTENLDTKAKQRKGFNKRVLYLALFVTSLPHACIFCLKWFQVNCIKFPKEY